MIAQRGGVRESRFLALSSLAPTGQGYRRSAGAAPVWFHGAMTDDSAPAQHPADSAYHRLLPIGEILDASAIAEGLPGAFDSVTMRPLEPMLVPEKPRVGEVDPEECGHCGPSVHTIWHDELWQVRAGWEVGGLPFIGGVAPREHWLLENAPQDVLAALDR